MMKLNYYHPKGFRYISMRNFFLLCSILLLQATSVFAQVKYKAPFNARYSPDMTMEQLYDTTFLQKMSKEDWVEFSQDPRFDAQRVSDIKTAWKENHKHTMGMRKSLQSSAEANCTWIEPTNDYEHPNTIMWPGSPGNSTDNYSDPINLGWNFDFFGTNYNQVVLTTKGTIVLGNSGYIDFTPSAFPDPLASESTQQYNHISAFWTDFDFGASGDLYYLLTPEALYVNYIDVGYWPNQGDKVNSMQIIITPNGSDVIGGGNNVQFTYYDMQFANSQISGAAGGCMATTNLANVGCDKSSGNQHYAFGRFNICNSDAYNGPYGVAANQQDGVDWLDGRIIEFNTSVSNFNVNQPPVVVGEACDTITMCIGETFDFELTFTSPESNQSTSIAWTQSGTGFSAGSTSGNYADLTNALFVASASNVGSNTVTITATDNGTPAASTTVTYVFMVEETTPPPITISGVTAICAGGETELTASPGFDSYTWSNGQQGQTAVVTTQGPITVIGHFGNCAAVAVDTIDVTPYFIPQLEGGNAPIEMCPGQDTAICVLGNYVSYEWYIYPGYDGEFVPGTPLDQPCAQVTGNVNGNYAILVTDENGCEGFNIKLVNITESFVCETNDDNNGAYCSSLESVDFCGYSNPAEDNLIIYGLSTNQNGWQGSYINVYIYPADGGPMEEYFFTTFAALGQLTSIMVGAGDSIAIEYFANGNNFQGNSLWVVNCGQTAPTIIPAPLTTGFVFNAMSTCYPSELLGQWTVNGPAGWNMTNMNQMTSTFTPGGYGVYELCFNDPACSIDHCYDLVYAEPPSISITPGLDFTMCDDQTLNQSLNVTDVGGTGVISWSGTGVTPASDQMSAVIGPYTGYTQSTIVASITNACGTASDQFVVNHQGDVPTPVMSTQHLCDNGTVTLDPIPSNLDNPNLTYEWSPGNENTSTLTVDESGTYTVVVSNLCDESAPVSAQVIDVIPATVTNFPDDYLLECNDDDITLTVSYNNASEYTINWTGPNTSSTNSVVADVDGNYCWSVTDIYNCNSLAQGCTQVNISDAPTTSSGGGDLMALCPNECELLEIIVNAENPSFTWTTSCSGYPINSSSAAIEYCANSVPQDCLGVPISITATVSNECGSDQATWSVQTNACEVYIPNIFTPNGDSENNEFYIRGLENYNNVELYVFNRWGNKVFESTNYLNNWTAEELSDGTYWYIIKLPYGLKTEYKGNITIMR